MKSLFEFVHESLINEGGHAVNGTPMTQPQARAVYQDVEKKFLSKLGLTADGVDHCALGSFGKKLDDQTSGDIDIAVSMDVIASKNGISLEDVENFIADMCAKDKLNFVNNPGTHVISLAWPIPGTKDYGQVDIMPSDSLDYTKWMYYSPDFRKAESKYKGLYRNQLIMAILKFTDQKILKANEEGQVVEYERYALRMNSGLARTRRSFEGKRGGLNKTEHALKEYEQKVSNVPDVICELAFGPGVTSSQILTFEETYARFMSNTFPHPEIREKVMKAFINEMIKNKFPIPSEVSADWSNLIP
jgi:hypothetical protein